MTLLMSETVDAASKRSVLGRAFEILDCFGGSHPEQTIAGVCAQTGLPPATVHRMLAHLVEWGAVERASRGHYRLGRRLWRLGWGVPEVRRLRDVARPFLVDLYSATSTPVALWSREVDDVILCDLIAGQSVARSWRPDRRVPILENAAGLALLAHARLEVLSTLVSRGDAAGSGTDSAEFLLRQRLGEVRRAGFAVTKPVREGGPAWVAAPVFDEEGKVRAAVSVATSSARLNAGALGRVVVAAAHDISRGMGHRVHTAHGQYRYA